MAVRQRGDGDVRGRAGDLLGELVGVRASASSSARCVAVACQAPGKAATSAASWPGAPRSSTSARWGRARRRPRGRRRQAAQSDRRHASAAASRSAPSLASKASVARTRPNVNQCRPAMPSSRSPTSGANVACRWAAASWGRPSSRPMPFCLRRTRSRSDADPHRDLEQTAPLDVAGKPDVEREVDPGPARRDDPAQQRLGVEAHLRDEVVGDLGLAWKCGVQRRPLDQRMALGIRGDAKPAGTVGMLGDQREQLDRGRDGASGAGVVTGDHEGVVDACFCEPAQQRVEVGAVVDRARGKVRDCGVAERGDLRRDIDGAIDALAGRAGDRDRQRTANGGGLGLGSADGQDLVAARHHAAARIAPSSSRSGCGDPRSRRDGGRSARRCSSLRGGRTAPRHAEPERSPTSWKTGPLSQLTIEPSSLPGPR